ncbi:hypothetical protein ACFPVX_04105 [Cohnella faecalis]|uniref:Uncharacterized protein n=1 Tax=Cohnella faecalis TaxID=2315694 RepID=A0A398CDN7_9BACL|nr:hypothetical protein [Cohnella faecalis]RIE00545.1 hypothetical protein D3H35_27790 [Cohnella faecalis]
MRKPRSSRKKSRSSAWFKPEAANRQIDAIRARIHLVESVMKQEQTAFLELQEQKRIFGDRLSLQLEEALSEERRLLESWGAR